MLFDAGDVTRKNMIKVKNSGVSISPLLVHLAEKNFPTEMYRRQKDCVEEVSNLVSYKKQYNS